MEMEEGKNAAEMEEEGGSAELRLGLEEHRHIAGGRLAVLLGLRMVHLHCGLVEADLDGSLAQAVVRTVHHLSAGAALHRISDGQVGRVLAACT